MNTTDTKRPTLSFDGKGINGPDEYRTRIATFRNDDDAQAYGNLFANALEMMDALRIIAAETCNHGAGTICPRAIANEAIVKAEGK